MNTSEQLTLSPANIRHSTPKGWNIDAHQLWINGNKAGAIESLTNTAKKAQENISKAAFIQLGSYLFMSHDYTSACTIFKKGMGFYPQDKELLLSITICLNKSKKYKETIKCATTYLRSDANNFTAWDCLSNSYYHLNYVSKSARAGNNALLLKDKRYGIPNSTWRCPTLPAQIKAANKKKVIAFSLWGNDNRYIYGALQNLLLAPTFYPEWELWFYIDNTVSKNIIDTIKALGGKIFTQKDGQSHRNKLCWKFTVSNHSQVGYFLIRNTDAIFNAREASLVNEWLASDRYFHVIRDWWTHIDPVIAGLWGGIAGVLPNIQSQLNNSPIHTSNNPSSDQTFINEQLWRYIKTHYLAHDSCFKYKNSKPIPGPSPTLQTYIGHSEFITNPQKQQQQLKDWIKDNNYYINQ